MFTHSKANLSLVKVMGLGVYLRMELQTKLVSSLLAFRLPLQVPGDRQRRGGKVLPPPPVHREQV